MNYSSIIQRPLIEALQFWIFIFKKNRITCITMISKYEIDQYEKI